MADPPSPKRLRRQYLLVLDLDNTLIHARDRPLARPAGSKPFVISLRADGSEHYHVYTRAGLKRFFVALERLMADGLHVAVWTAAERTYAVRILDRIWPAWRDRIDFLYTRCMCTTLANGALVKDMRTLPVGYSTMLVDDNDDTTALNATRDYSVWHIPYFAAGERADSELKHVADFTESVMRSGQRFPAEPRRVDERRRAVERAEHRRRAVARLTT